MNLFAAIRKKINDTVNFLKRKPVLFLFLMMGCVPSLISFRTRLAEKSFYDTVRHTNLPSEAIQGEYYGRPTWREVNREINVESCQAYSPKWSGIKGKYSQIQKSGQLEFDSFRLAYKDYVRKTWVFLHLKKAIEASPPSLEYQKEVSENSTTQLLPNSAPISISKNKSRSSSWQPKRSGISLGGSVAVRDHFDLLPSSVIDTNLNVRRIEAKLAQNQQLQIANQIADEEVKEFLLKTAENILRQINTKLFVYLQRNNLFNIGFAKNEFQANSEYSGLSTKRRDGSQEEINFRRESFLTLCQESRVDGKDFQLLVDTFTRGNKAIGKRNHQLRVLNQLPGPVTSLLEKTRESVTVSAPLQQVAKRRSELKPTLATVQYYGQSLPVVDVQPAFSLDLTSGSLSVGVGRSLFYPMHGDDLGFFAGVSVGCTVTPTKPQFRTWKYSGLGLRVFVGIGKTFG